MITPVAQLNLFFFSCVGTVFSYNHPLVPIHFTFYVTVLGQCTVVNLLLSLFFLLFLAFVGTMHHINATNVPTTFTFLLRRWDSASFQRHLCPNSPYFFTLALGQRPKIALFQSLSQPLSQLIPIIIPANIPVPPALLLSI